MNKNKLMRAVVKVIVFDKRKDNKPVPEGSVRLILQAGIMSRLATVQNPAIAIPEGWVVGKHYVIRTKWRGYDKKNGNQYSISTIRSLTDETVEDAMDRYGDPVMLDDNCITAFNDLKPIDTETPEGL